LLIGATPFYLWRNDTVIKKLCAVEPQLLLYVLSNALQRRDRCFTCAYYRFRGGQSWTFFFGLCGRAKKISASYEAFGSIFLRENAVANNLKLIDLTAIMLYYYMEISTRF